MSKSAHSSKVCKLVLGLRDEYLEQGAASAWEINEGQCEDFACELVTLLQANGFGTAEDIGVSEFLQFDPNDDNDYGYPFDRDNLEKRFPGFTPPGDLSLDDLDHLSFNRSFSPGTHVWVLHEGKHYDAEAPDGVASFMELPFFQRCVRHWIEEGRPERPVRQTSAFSP